MRSDHKGIQFLLVFIATRVAISSPNYEKKYTRKYVFKVDQINMVGSMEVYCVTIRG